MSAPDLNVSSHGAHAATRSPRSPASGPADPPERVRTRPAHEPASADAGRHEWVTASVHALVGEWAAVYADDHEGTWHTAPCSHLVLQIRGPNRENRVLAAQQDGDGTLVLLAEPRPISWVPFGRLAYYLDRLKKVSRP
jgi:hypothetical protein